MIYEKIEPSSSIDQSMQFIEELKPEKKKIVKVL